MNIPPQIRPVLIGASAIIALTVAMIIIEQYTSTIAPAPYLKDGMLTETQKQSLAVMFDLIKLLMNLTIAVIGASAFFLRISVEKGILIRDRDLVLTFCIILLCILSLFLGHLVIHKSSEMLSLDQFPVSNETVRSLGRYQYVCALGAISIFGLHVLQFFYGRKAGN